MIRILVVGYVFAIRSERLICREVQVYRWFCKLGIEDAIPDHSAFSRARNERFRDGDIFRHMFERVVEACIAACWGYRLRGGSDAELAGRGERHRAPYSRVRKIEAERRHLLVWRLSIWSDERRLPLPRREAAWHEWHRA
jgi:hypothetical protein